MTVDVAVKLDGARDAAAGMLQAGEIKIGAMERAMLMEGHELMAEAQLEVPRRTGFLANSQFVTLVKRGKDSTVIIGFSAPYALHVHEAPPTRVFRVGKRKFLEDPFKRRERDAPARIAERVRAFSP